MELVVVLDRKGRVVIPQEIRKEFETRRFIAKKIEGRIELIPLPNPKSLRGRYRIEGDLTDLEELQERKVLERT